MNKFNLGDVVYWLEFDQHQFKIKNGEIRAINQTPAGIFYKFKEKLAGQHEKCLFSSPDALVEFYKEQLELIREW